MKVRVRLELFKAFWMQVGVNKVSMLSLLVFVIAIDATVECAKKNLIQ